MGRFRALSQPILCTQIDLVTSSRNFDVIFIVIHALFTNKCTFSKMGPKSKELSLDRKQIVVDLKREGKRNCEIVELLKIPESTIRSFWKTYQKRGNVENIPRVGRPRKITERREPRLLRSVKKTRGKVLRETTNNLNQGQTALVKPKTIQKY